MKFAKIMLMFVIVTLLFVFGAACAGQDDNADIIQANVQLQEQVLRLMDNFQALMEANNSLQEELRHFQNQVAELTNPPLNGEFFDFPVFYQDFESLLNGYSQAFGIEQIALQNLADSSSDMEYILWRGSWDNLSLTQDYINQLVQNGWELVNMFGAGRMNGIVVVMRR